MKDIWIANDHGGYQLKLVLLDHLHKQGIACRDMGSEGEEIVRYPYYAALVADAVSRGEIERGILICSTGIGMSIIANKYPGVRAAQCRTTYDARMTRAHNNANVLCLGGKTVGPFEALDMLDAWLNTEYMGGRHDISLGLIEEAEAVNLTGARWSPGLENML